MPVILITFIRSHKKGPELHKSNKSVSQCEAFMITKSFVVDKKRRKEMTCNPNAVAISRKTFIVKVSGR